MNLTLNALPDDFKLNAEGDLPRSEGISYPVEYNLTAPNGDLLTDPSGNQLVGYFEEVVYPQVLSALPDDFQLTTE